MNLSKLVQEMVKSVLEDCSLLEARRTTYKTLYHIGPRPASPKPFKSTVVRYKGKTSWDRYYLKNPVRSGVFMSDDWKGIWMNHGIMGNVYAYKVPMAAIEDAGGIHEYDNGREVFFSKEIWEKYGLSKTFLGKTLSKNQADELLVKDARFSKTANATNNIMFANQDKAKWEENEKRHSLERFLHISSDKQKEILRFFSEKEKQTMLRDIAELVKGAERIEKELKTLRRKFVSFQTKVDKNGFSDEKERERYREMSHRIKRLKEQWETLDKYKEVIPTTRENIEKSLNNLW